MHSSPQLQASRALLDKDWEAYTEALGHLGFGWSEHERARAIAAYVRECATPEDFRASLARRDGLRHQRAVDGGPAGDEPRSQAKVILWGLKIHPYPTPKEDAWI